MKVYLITCGEYSEYQVCGILIDKEKAERFCAEWNSSWYFNGGDVDIDLVRVSSEPFRVEECETDDDQMEMQNEVKRIFGMRQCNGFKEDFARGGLVSTDVNQCSAKQYEQGEYIEVIATLPKDISDEKAKKIMYDRIAKFKAERAGVIL